MLKRAAAGRREDPLEERAPARAEPVPGVLDLQRSAGNHAVAGLVGSQRTLQRFLGVGTFEPMRALVDAAEIAAWLAPRSTAAELRALRLEVQAVQDGQQYRLPFHEVTMDAPQRTRLKEAVRHRVMERIAELRRARAAELAATTDAEGRRGVQATMRGEARPFLDELRDPDQPGARFEHPSPDVQREVLAALELDGEGHAEEELAAQATQGSAGPRDRARAAAGLPEGAWCGAFAYTQQHAAGLGAQARVAMHYTGPNGGVDAFLEYGNPGASIWTGAEWKLVREYHDERNSLRKLVRLPSPHVPITPGSAFAPEGLDIQPGDVVLIDNLAGVFADHIVQCRSYDPATGMLETIGGNEGSSPGEVRASARPRDLNQNPDKRVAEGFKSDSRVYAYGRFSIVDYEVHTYHPTMPANRTESPEAMAARQRGRAH